MPNNGLNGQRVPPPEVLAALPVGWDIYTYFGQTETVYARPAAGAKALVLWVDANTARYRTGDFKGKVFTAANATEIFTSVGHGFATGDGPFPVSNSGGALPAGLAANTPYWVIRLDNDTFKLATSYADAIAGTFLLISTDGSGTQTIAGLPAAEAPAAVSNGFGSIYLTGAGTIRVLAAPEKFTLRGYNAATAISFYWLP
jgi:hypothetical protein